MAVKWAIVDGNWSSGATWNDGVVPVSGDKVYTNGHIVNLTTLTTIFTTDNPGELHNDANSEYNIVAGGYFTKSTEGSTTINADVYGGNASTYVFYFNCTSTANKIITINGNVVSTGCIIASMQGINATYRIGTITVNGNIELFGNARMYYANSASVNITGEYIKHHSTNICFQVGATLRDVNIIVSEVIIDGGGSLFSPFVPSNVGITFGGDVTLRNHSKIMNFSTTSDWAGKSITIGGNLTIGDTSSFISGMFGQTNSEFVISGKLILEDFAGSTSYSSWADYTLFSYIRSFIIGGGIEGNGAGMVTGGAIQFQTTTINGNIDVNGDIIVIANNVVSLTFLSGTEYIRYDKYFPLPVHRANAVTVTNPNGIKVYYTGNEAPDFMVIGKGNILDEDQYPAEQNVKENTTYAFGAMTGTLKQIQTNNTINIYPYAKRYPV